MQTIIDIPPFGIQRDIHGTTAIACFNNYRCDIIEQGKSMKENRVMKILNRVKGSRVFLSIGEIFTTAIKDVIKDIWCCPLGYKPHPLQER